MKNISIISINLRVIFKSSVMYMFDFFCQYIKNEEYHSDVSLYKIYIAYI